MRNDLPAAGERQHIACLDGLRGVAALAVLAHHTEFAVMPFAKGYLAVDFFFCLSGYVIGLAYEARLAAGLSLRSYALLRLERLWPMLFIGASIGLCTIPFGEGDGYFVPTGDYNPFLAFALQMLFIPFVLSNGAFVLNEPQWSILYELIANFVHAAFVRYLNNWLVAGIIAMSAVSLILIGRRYEYINFGWGSDNFWLGMPRVGYSFFAGLLLYRTRPRWGRWLPEVPFAGLAIILLLLLGLPDIHPIGFTGAPRDLVVDLILLPLIVALAAKSTSQGRLLRELGTLSYPLYATHNPLLLAAFWLQFQLGLGDLFVLAMDAVCIILALLLGHYVDEPLIRARKRARLRRSG